MRARAHTHTHTRTHTHTPCRCGAQDDLEAVCSQRDAALHAMSEHEVADLREQLEAAESTLTGRKMSSLAAENQALRKQVGGRCVHV